MRIKRRIFGRMLAGLGATAAVLTGRALGAVADIGVIVPGHPWGAANFDYAVADRRFPGIAIRLPGTERNIFAACLICPHQACIVGYETDYQTVGDIVGKTFSNPVLFCRCHLSVYDPAQQGRVLFGPAPRPPWLFDVSEDHGTVIVKSIEQGAGEINQTIAP